MRVKFKVSAKGMNYCQYARNCIRTFTLENLQSRFGCTVHQNLYQRTIFEDYIPKSFGYGKYYMTMGNIYYLIYCLIYPFVYILLSTGGAETTLTGKGNSFLRSALHADILCIPIGRVFTREHLLYRFNNRLPMRRFVSP